MITYALEPAAEEEALAVLAARFRTLAEEPPLRRRTWYDTFDWRLHRDGGTLAAGTPGTGAGHGITLLEWRRLDGELRHRARMEGEPAFAEGLPPGSLREEMAPVIEMRRLLPRAEVELAGPQLRVLDGEGKTVVRALFATGTARDRGGAPQPLEPRLRVLPVKGYDRELEAVAHCLEEGLGLHRRDEDEVTTALAALGRRPRDYSSKLDLSLDPEMSVGEAARAIHRRLLATIRANEEGTRRDLDSEFLHDFRVAVRRTRSALGQIKGVFAAAATEHFRRGFARLGRLTGPTRDLDVYLLKFEGYRRGLLETERGHLDPLKIFLREHQRVEQRRLARALGGRRHCALLAAWEEFLAGEDGRGAAAGRPVTEVARRRIWKVWRRVLRGGRAIGPETPATALHRLRIECKKLRYLLEFFRSLFPEEEIGKPIRALKKLQDNLGDFNDYEVQQRQLAAFAEQMVLEDLAPVPTLLAMGRLLERLAGGQARERARFAERFSAFAAKGNRRRFRRLFRPGEGAP